MYEKTSRRRSVPQLCEEKLEVGLFLEGICVCQVDKQHLHVNMLYLGLYIFCSFTSHIWIFLFRCEMLRRAETELGLAVHRQRLMAQVIAVTLLFLSLLRGRLA